MSRTVERATPDMRAISRTGRQLSRYIRITSRSARIFALLVGISFSWLLSSPEEGLNDQARHHREGGRELIGMVGGISSESRAGIPRNGGRHHFGIRTDARLRADADRVVACAVEAFGGLDILVNNAQSAPAGVMLADHDDTLIAEIVESGLYGSIYHMQAARPHLAARGGGSIINFGSRQGIIAPPGYAVYAAAKEGIRGLSRGAAREWGSDNIRVNVINPSAITPVAERWLADFPEEAAKNLSEVSLQRWGEAYADIAPVAVFLASDESRYVTGQTINVDGGMVML